MIDGKIEQRTILEIELDPLEEERGGFGLNDFQLANPELGIYGSAGRSISNGTEVYKGQLEFIAGKVPAGIVELQVTGASLLAHGPWEASWTIPGRDPAKGLMPIRLFPQSAAGNQQEVEGGQRPPEQPVIEEVFLSDRLTAIKLDAAGLPPGSSFVQALSYDPTNFESNQRKVDLYLKDNWGRRYDPGGNQAFIRPDGEVGSHDPRWRFFPPLEPLAQSLSLHVPGIEAFKPGEASFEVVVPQDVTFEPEEITAPVFVGGLPERQVTQTYWFSDPWPVDISLDLAGYRLHFTQARVEHDVRSDPPYRLILLGEPPPISPDGSHLDTLRFSEVRQPDGKTVKVDPALLYSGAVTYPQGSILPVERGSNQLLLRLVLNVTATGRDDLLSGGYHVEINGVTEWVPGPWELRFSLSGH